MRTLETTVDVPQTAKAGHSVEAGHRGWLGVRCQPHDERLCDPFFVHHDTKRELPTTVQIQQFD
jgi:hypothetical protein